MSSPPQCGQPSLAIRPWPMRDNKLSPPAAVTVPSAAATASVSSARATATLSPVPNASAAAASASASSRNASPRCTASKVRIPESQIENGTSSTHGLRHPTASHQNASAQHSSQLERFPLIRRVPGSAVLVEPMKRSSAADTASTPRGLASGHLLTGTSGCSFTHGSRWRWHRPIGRRSVAVARLPDGAGSRGRRMSRRLPTFAGRRGTPGSRHRCRASRVRPPE